MVKLPRPVLRFCWLLAAMTLVTTTVGAQDILKRTQVSSPTIVRTEYDMDTVVAPPVHSPDEVRGRQVFIQRCAICHDPLGQPSFPRTPGPWVDAATIRSLGEDTVKSQIMMGSARMPGWQYTLTALEVDQVIAFLKTITPEQRPSGADGWIEDNFLR